MKAFVVSAKILLTLVICTALSIVFNVLASLVIDSEHMPYWLNGPKAFFVIVGAVVVMLLIFKKDRSLPLGLAGHRKTLSFAAGSLYGIGLVLISFIAVYVVGEVEFASLELSRAILVSVGVGSLIALCDSITEEMLFRGYLQAVAKTSFGTWSGIFISAVPFAILHALGHDVFSHPLVFINLILAGIFLALLREMSGSLWPPIGFHFTWNAVNRMFGGEESLIQLRFASNQWISGGTLGFDAGIVNTFIMTTIIIVLSIWFKFAETEPEETNLSGRSTSTLPPR